MPGGILYLRGGILLHYLLVCAQGYYLAPAYGHCLRLAKFFINGIDNGMVDDEIYFLFGTTAPAKEGDTTSG